MKKLLALPLLAALLLSACGGNEETATETKSDKPATSEEKKNEPTQEELDAKLKEEATTADFVKLNVDNPPVDEKVTAKGKVSIVYQEGVGGSFMLETKEGSGYGMYNILNYSLADVKEDDEVTIYGTTTGKKADDGSPQINATIIEVN
ncbi:DNA-binding protein [Priestia endophytica]|uniref:DNA-binding protein n=1 Tax=Priestia endophytica TaxID=135735 RepID=UPI00203E1BF1|nr:DNA-binding protein [Priestia endophytica]MCM3536607.1 DNA-binding protein [Priestia endophytica]